MGNVCNALCKNSDQLLSSDPAVARGQEMQKQVNSEICPRRNKNHYFNEKNIYSMECKDLPSLSLENIRRHYVWKKGKIGVGQFGEIRMASLKKDPTRFVAIKNIKKIKNNMPMIPYEMEKVMREIELLKRLDHPNIIRFIEVYEDRRNYFIVQEFCSKGNLKELILRSGSLSESIARRFTFEILTSLNYLHDSGIVHLDLKAENFLLSNTNNHYTLKMIDFGLSFPISKLNELKRVRGTIYYMAPEVFLGEYSPKVDLWGVGVILYFMLVGKLPFDGESTEEIENSILNEMLDYDLLISLKVSKSCISFLSHLLDPNPASRYDAKRAITHSWITQEAELIKRRGLKSLTPEMINNLINFKHSSLVQREMTYVMLHAFEDEADISNLRDIFLSIDENFSGTIETDEIIKLASFVGITLSEEDAERIINNIYYNEKGVISFTEFEAGMVDKQFFIDESRLHRLYNYLDRDSSGNLGEEQIEQCFKRFGLALTKEKIKRMIKESDFDGDGKISFEEIKKIMHREVAKY